MMEASKRSKKRKAVTRDVEPEAEESSGAEFDIGLLEQRLSQHGIDIGNDEDDSDSEVEIVNEFSEDEEEEEEELDSDEIPSDSESETSGLTKKRNSAVDIDI